MTTILASKETSSPDNTLIGVHPKTVIRWDSEGFIRTIWMGGKKRIPPSEVRQILEFGVDLEGRPTR